MNPVILGAYEISKSFPTRGQGRAVVLNRLALDLCGGELVALTGRNGCGKTTLLRTLAGLLTPETGEIRFFGRLMDGARRWASGRVGYLPADDRGFYPSLSIEENLAFFGTLFQLSAQETTEHLRIFERRFEVALTYGKPYQQLSTGQRRLAALAKATLHAPSVLLLDEPTRGLDPVTAERVQSRLRVALLDGAYQIAVWVTHRADEAARCDGHAELQNGTWIWRRLPQRSSTEKSDVVPGRLSA